MKRIAGLSLIGVLLLTGCSAGPSKPTPTPKLTSNPSEVFIKTVRGTNALVGAGNQQLVKLGNSLCAAMKDGSSFNRVVELLGTGGVKNADDAEVIARASIDSFCPEVDRG